MVSACILLAYYGTEEMEFTITYDILVRAGINCTSIVVYENRERERKSRFIRNSVAEVGLEYRPFETLGVEEYGHGVWGSRGMRILAREFLEFDEVGKLVESFLKRFDAVVIPGGATGAQVLSQDERVQGIVRAFWENGKVVGMICAGSLAAYTAELHKTSKAGTRKIALTSHPDVEYELGEDFDYREDPVVVHDNLVTSRGPGTAFLFALQLVEMLCGAEKRKEITKPMVFPKWAQLP